MSEWEPISESKLQEIIKNSEALMEEKDKSFWKLIKLPEPTKWQNHPWGDKGKGFWVVAVFGNQCVYYNDIEEGFNESIFNSWGIIDNYYCDQLELHESIGLIFNYGLNRPRRGAPSEL